MRSRGKVVERDADGKPLRIAGTARDITASARAPSASAASPQEVMRSMGEAVTVTDLEFRFISVNPAFSRMTGYREDEVVGQRSRAAQLPAAQPTSSTAACATRSMRTATGAARCGSGARTARNSCAGSS